MKTFNKAFYFPLLFLFLLFNLTTFAGAAPIAFTNVQIDAKDSITINGSILQIGNQLLCVTGNTGNGNSGTEGGVCVEPTEGEPNNDWWQFRAKVDTNASSPFNTMAKLVLQADDEVLLARLYWSARTVDAATAESAAARDIKIKGPASTVYTQLTAPADKHGSVDWDYGASADVTQYIKDNGAGDYYVGDILTDSGIKGIYASWQLVVVVKNAARSLKNIAIYDGFQSVHTSTTSSITVDAGGFITPTGTELFDANLFIYTGESDADYGDSVEILAGDGTTWHSLTDGQGTVNDVVNASIYSPDFPTTGYRSDEAGMADPNFRNVLGVDIDKLLINDKMNASKQFLSNSQTTTKIRISSLDNGHGYGDRYSLNMFAFETEVFVPEFCYDYAYKQQGKYFTETNDGSQDPRLTGDITNGEPVEVTIYLKSLVDASIQIQDMELDVYDINNSQADLNTTSVKLAKVGYYEPITPSYSTSTIGEQDFINDIDVGVLDQNDYFYLYYTLDPKVTTLDMPISVEASYNLVLDSTSVPYHLRLSQDIPLCTGGAYDYTPYTGTFNVVHNNYYNNSTQLYNMPTQVTSRAGSFKVIATSATDHDLLEPKSTIVAIDMIDAAAFQTTDASCRETDSAISERIWVTFDNNSSTVMFDEAALQEAILNNPNISITTPAEFYANARENAAFRVSYHEIKENNGSLVSHEMDGDKYLITNFTDLVQDFGTCSHEVMSPSGVSHVLQPTIQVSVACGSEGNSISKVHYNACLECLYGYDTKFVCSRDNFSIRPEAFSLELNDQDQANPVSLLRLADSVSGVDGTAGISTDQTQLAAGYQYKLEIDSVNHLNKSPTFGYTKTFEDNSTEDYVMYSWSPSSAVTDCNTSSYTKNDFKIVDGSIDMNSSLEQVGEYTLLMRDTTWTSVDSNPSYMGHHAGDYFLDPNIYLDCLPNSDTQSVSAVTTNATPLQGCNISSDHDGSGSTYRYRDYDVAFHPYRFILNTPPTVGLSHDDVNATSYVYMSDMSVGGQDENMSYHLNGTIVPAGENNSTLSNFVNGCYAKPLNMDLNKSTINLPVAYQYRFHSLDENGVDLRVAVADLNNSGNSVSVLTTDFPTTFTAANLGSANTILNLNYNRTVNSPQNPEEITFHNYDAECTTPANCTFNADLISNQTSKGTKVLNSSVAVKHYYGRTHASRHRFTTASGDAFIYYEAYCSGTTGGTVCDKTKLQDLQFSKYSDDPRWFKNTKHNVVAYGDAGTVSQKGGAGLVTPDTVAPYDNVVIGRTRVPLTYDGTRGYPYKTTMENNESGWLIYNRFDAAATTNEFEVEFANSGSGWAGVKEDTTNTTTKTGSSKTNRRSMW